MNWGFRHGKSPSHSIPASKLDGAVVLLFLGYLITVFCCGEHILVNDGLGWDGLTYGRAASNFKAFAKERWFSEYYAQRSLPSFLVFIAGTLIRCNLKHLPNIVWLFFGLNMLGLVASLVTTEAIAKARGWTRAQRWIYFSFVYANYAVLKMLPFYPVLTDYAALYLGNAIVYFYIKRSNRGLLFTSIVGSFVFPRTICLSALSVYLLLDCNLTRSTKALDPITPQTQSLAVIPIGILISWSGACTLSALTLLFWTVHFLGPGTGYWLPIARAGVRPYRLLAISGILMSVQAVIRLISDPALGGFYASPWHFLKFIVGTNLTLPAFTNFVAHVVYYGPPFVLVFLAWPTLLRNTIRFHPELVPSLVMFSILSINVESRTWINFLPILAFALVEVLGLFKLGPSSHIYVLCSSILASKFWFPLRPELWANCREVSLYDALTGPAQAYFCSQGHLMSAESYLAQGLITLILTSVCLQWWLSLRAEKSGYPVP